MVKIQNLLKRTRVIIYGISILVFSCCQTKKEIYKGDWGVEKLRVLDENYLNDSVFKESMFQPVFQLDDLNLKFRLDTMYLFSCKYRVEGETFLIEDCSNDKFNGDYRYNLKKLVDTKFRKEYSLELENQNVYILLHKTDIDFSLGKSN